MALKSFVTWLLKYGFMCLMGEIDWKQVVLRTKYKVRSFALMRRGCR
jgi:hypothetical protein